MQLIKVALLSVLFLPVHSLTLNVMMIAVDEVQMYLALPYRSHFGLVQAITMTRFARQKMSRAKAFWFSV